MSSVKDGTKQTPIPGEQIWSHKSQYNLLLMCSSWCLLCQMAKVHFIPSSSLLGLWLKQKLPTTPPTSSLSSSASNTQGFMSGSKLRASEAEEMRPDTWPVILHSKWKTKEDEHHFEGFHHVLAPDLAENSTEGHGSWIVVLAKVLQLAYRKFRAYISEYIFPHNSNTKRAPPLMFHFTDFQPFSYSDSFIYFKKENQIKKSMLYMQFYNQLFKMNIIVNIGLCNLNLSVTVFH